MTHLTAATTAQRAPYPPYAPCAVLADQELLEHMRSGREDVCAEFVSRFRPTLEAFAKKTKIPVWEWDTCITEVLVDESMRFSTRTVDVPVNVQAYLIKAVRNRYLRIKRSDNCRERYHSAASVNAMGEWVVRSLCSESALRSSAGPDAPPDSVSSTLTHLAEQLGRNLTDEERSILTWVSQGVPHRQIAKWLDVSYDAASKRIWRLCRRLRAQAARHAQAYGARERDEIARFLRRAG